MFTRASETKGSISIHTYIKQILLYSVETQQIILLSIYKSSNMFRLIEPSSSQFINHIEGTFIDVHIWDPTMCTSTECTFNMIYELAR